MRILLITDTLSPGYGWGRYSIGLIHALQRQGLDFGLLSPKRLCEVDDLRELAQHLPVTSFVSETRRIPRLVLANALPIRRALREYDAVHCLTEPYAVPAALVAGRKPLLVSLHGTYAVRPFSQWRERPWYDMAYRRAARLLPVSRLTRSLLPSRFQGPKTQVVPDCVDLERFALPEGGTRGHDGPPFLLSVGPLKRRKGYHVAVEAFARVHAERPDAQYWIVGGTDDRVYLAQIQQRIVELGLAEAVRFLGRVSEEELVRLYHRCAAFWLLPVFDRLQFEAFGLVYWEANACGRPVVGSRESGAEEAIEDGVNGFLVPPEDAEAASRAALRLLDDPALAERLGQAGRVRVRPWDDAARLVMDQYHDVLGGTLPSLQGQAATSHA
jgi:glycosyltransferase involved in cell wall biosynthesis